MPSNADIVHGSYRWSAAAVILAAAALPYDAALAAPTTIVAEHSGKCLDVIGGPNATGNGVQLEQWSCVTNAGNQAFTLQDMGSSQYQIVASHSNKCLGTVNGGTANGTRIEQLDCAGLPKQLWKVVKASTAGKYSIVSAQGGRCLDVTGGPGATADGAMMNLWDCVGATNQTWALSVPASSPAVPAVPLVSKLSGKCMQVIGGVTGTGSGLRLDQWTCAPSATNQAFTFKDMGDSQFQMIAKHSGKCIQVVGASTVNGAPVDQADCNSTPQQLWKVNSLADNYKQIVSVSSGKCLDVTGGNSATSDGALMEQWECAAGAGNQTWTIGGATPTTTTSTISSPTTTTMTSVTTTTVKIVAPAPAPIPPQSCTPTNLTPAIATKAAWDAKYNAQYGSTIPNISRGAEDYAWQGHYWVRAYVSMAKTYGDTKYLDTAVRMIDYWMSHTDSPQGWGSSLGASQMSLDTGVISEAVTLFAYTVWKDARFTAYRAKADGYVAKLEPILNSYNNQWVDNAPYSGSPSFYVYASCGGVCSPASLMMYNQGTVLTKPMLLIDRIKRLKGQTPNASYLYKADKAAAYFKTFARLSGNAYVWDYGGARGSGIEDTSHGHLDLQHLLWAKQYNLGGLTNTDMSRLVATMHKVLNGQPGPNDVARYVNGTGASDNYTRVSIGYDWIDLADYDRTLLDKTINVFNRHMPNPTSARFYLGWAEIQRKRNCVSLY